MDFLDNMVKSSNALLRERLNNPFAKQTNGNNNNNQASQGSEPANSQQAEATQSQASGSANQSTIQPSTSTNNPADQTSDSQTSPVSVGDENGDKNSRFAAIAADAEAVTQKATQGAKNIGNFLFSMANKAGQHVHQTAKQVKQAVESSAGILTDFTREQQEFIKEHGGSIQAGDLPWTDCGDEAKCNDIREQILSLSQDKRNFVKGPPGDANFQFNSEQCYPIALSLLKEDPNLSKMRYELVPKLVNEDTFWRNYFYRVSLLRQMSDKGKDIKSHGWTSSRSSSGEGPDDCSAPAAGEASQLPGDEASQQDPASDMEKIESSYQYDTSNLGTDEIESSESRKLIAESDDLKRRLKELNIGSFDGGSQDEDDKWDEELQKDLQEFELISGDVSALDEEALNEEIMNLQKFIKKT